MRLTIACPAALIADANHLAMVLGYSPAEANTYDVLSWKDVDGELYAAASLPVTDEFVATALSGLSRPEWDTAETVDLVAAGRAQAAIILWLGDDTPAPLAVPDKLTVHAGDVALSALAAMGLTRV